MKKLNLLTATAYCLLITVFSLFPSQSKAQDDPNAGIYIDGTFVDKIDCWTFNTMSCIFPITEKFKKYEVIVVQVKYDRTEFNRSYPDGVQSIFTFELTFNQEKLDGNFGDAKYGVYKFLRDKAVDEISAIRLTNAYGAYTSANSFQRNQFAGWDETKPGKYKYYKYKSNISFDVFGATINGYAFDTKGINKAPIFENIVYLYKSSKIPINNCESCPWDINATCPLTGKKVDLKIEKSLAYEEKFALIKGGVSSSNNSNTDITKTTTETETKTKANPATKTNTVTNASSAAGVKPLDKAKPGYFAEKNGSVITREGYKKGSALNGEVRDYNDDGKIRSIYTYVNDEKTGYSATYYDNGKIELTGNYKNGEKDGEWKEYDETGKLLSTKKYLNGEVQD